MVDDPRHPASDQIRPAQIIAIRSPANTGVTAFQRGCFGSAATHSKSGPPTLMTARATLSFFGEDLVPNSTSLLAETVTPSTSPRLRQLALRHPKTDHEPSGHRHQKNCGCGDQLVGEDGTARAAALEQRCNLIWKCWRPPASATASKNFSRYLTAGLRASHPPRPCSNSSPDNAIVFADPSRFYPQIGGMYKVTLGGK
jgi:hypothetical protein